MHSEDNPVPQGEQANLVHPDPPNPPFQDELTIIWRREKAELHNRLDRQEQVIEAMSQRVKTLEEWAVQLKREPTVFTEKPLSEHPLYKRDKPDQTAWDASKPTPGAGIGHAIPKVKESPAR